ncbi:MAG: YggT family protein [Acidobacteria bacterium]|nr:YggT family protein [Acidobacteriota bacterium]
MPQDKNLFVEEERRLEKYEDVKDAARNEIQEQVKRRADHLTPSERADVEALGNELKGGAISEVRSTDLEVRRARRMARLSQVIDYVFYLIYGLISLQIIFDLFGAHRSNGIRNFIDALSWPFLSPFKNLFPDPSSGRFQIRFSYVAALVIYLLLHLAVTGLLRMVAHRKAEI